MREQKNLNEALEVLKSFQTKGSNIGIGDC